MYRKSEITREGKILKREKYAAPRTAAGVASVVQDALEAGGWVERLVIQNGFPIQVYRYVDKEDLHEQPIDLKAALRHSRVIEHDYDGTCSWEQVARAVQILSSEQLWAVCWVVGPTASRLAQWLNLKSEPTSLLQIPIEFDDSLPDETLMLAASRNSEADISDIVISFRLVMELPSDSKISPYVQEILGGSNG